MLSRMSLLQNVLGFCNLPLRSCHTLPEGIKYPGFTYYPRTHNFKDPPYEPSKLLLVIRCKSLKGSTSLEKEALKNLKVDGAKSCKGHINVVKNIPSVNAILWRVKHLVKIKPITWKGELPKDDDFAGTYLRETGELVITPRLKLTSANMEATEKYLSQPNFLNRRYFRDYLRKKWNLGFSGDV